MQPTMTLVLVRSAHPQWGALHVALAAQPAVRIVGDIGPTQPLGTLAGRHPAVMLVTADLVTRPPVPLVRALRALSPDSKIILLGATATLDGAALITLHDQGIRGYFVWEELRPETVRRALLLVVEDEALVGSPIVLATLRAALERRRGARVEGLVLTPEQRATWTRPTGKPSVALTPREREVAELIADGYTTREIGAQLYITEDTVNTHVRAMMRKFDVTSRRALGRAFRAQGAADGEGGSTSG
jgi:DNA-binding NarL/FixJ family response regulator